MSRRILFVDDEPHLLSGLRRMLRVKSKDWHMSFATSGQEALQILAEEPFDVVVSDMRMPGMDGAQLLAEVRRRHPGTARMILSGHANRESVISAVGPTQQYLAKPCEIGTLTESVERVLKIRDLVTDERIRDVLGGVDSLPKPPQVYEEMLAVASDPDCSIKDVVRVIERDLATSAEVIHLVNSAFFGLPSRAETVTKAVRLLGLETIQALALAGAVFSSGGPMPPGLSSTQLQTRGLSVGTLARRFSTNAGWPRTAVSDMFLAGLLHEVGLPLLAVVDPVTWRELVYLPAPADLWEEAERQRGAFGCTATEATAYLLGLWGFGDVVVQSIAAQPVLPGDPAATSGAHLLTIARMLAADPTRVPEPDSQGFLSPERALEWAAIAVGVHQGIQSDPLTPESPSPPR
ncbi:MAG: response regulator [Actinomycetota bacterium]|nr:response regulator [Actinomycetota bacterium]